ncbi:hypothetical protein [Pseudomonas fluorescens]|uniref:hypothetical protein n=1 Tax=Pseudomonas fluorescens TaxID=294 RepID=UPI001BE6DC4B|nr:hypothetical protein [Pseudomonas fluorescens]MBT2372337.1 hypothetical protein [Pseudomonas fluorescens]
MNENLSEEEMRLALFGPSVQAEKTPPVMPEPKVTPALLVPKPKPKALSPKLRVTLRVSKDFEGDTELFTHDANTLSTLIAEQEAKNEAKKKKFKYFEVISVNPN